MPGPAYYTATINLAQNADWSVHFIYGTLASNGVDVNPFDLTGFTFELEIRIAESDHEAIVLIDSSDGIYFKNGDPTTGEFTINITREKSQRLYPGTFVADLIQIMPNGYRQRLIDATVIVVEGTTR
jgi:hypothetical protein